MKAVRLCPKMSAILLTALSHANVKRMSAASQAPGVDGVLTTNGYMEVFLYLVHCTTLSGTK